LDTSKLRKVDHALIARSVETTENAVVYTLKQIAMAVETAMKKSYNVKLNFRLGWLKFNDNCFYFDNLAQKSDLDNVTMTSCNTEFRANKWFMTNFK
jgi:flavin-binding protein dodecin